MAKMSAKAHTPNTASTSANRCQKPACGPPLCASRAKNGTERMKDRHREQQGGDDFDGLGHGWASVIRDDDCALPA